MIYIHGDVNFENIRKSKLLCSHIHNWSLELVKFLRMVSSKQIYMNLNFHVFKLQGALTFFFSMYNLCILAMMPSIIYLCFWETKYYDYEHDYHVEVFFKRYSSQKNMYLLENHHLISLSKWSIHELKCIGQNVTR